MQFFLRASRWLATAKCQMQSLYAHTVQDKISHEKVHRRFILACRIVLISERRCSYEPPPKNVK